MLRSEHEAPSTASPQYHAYNCLLVYYIPIIVLVLLVADAVSAFFSVFEIATE